MKNICTSCKYYPRTWFQKLFKLTKFQEYAKCQHPDTMYLYGKKTYCETQRSSNNTECGIKGLLFELWELK